jgi:hypothetical protein
MHNRFIGWSVVAAGLALPAAALADRAPEERAAATHVVLGRVAQVYFQEGARGANQDYVVEMAIEKVERGEGLKAADTIYVSCYRPNPRPPDLKKLSERERRAYLFTVDGGHNPPPKKGDRVRVFIKGERGKYHGIFPDWVEVLAKR